jgi:hypothetical protein
MALDMELDLIGAQPALFRLYTQLAFIFHVSEKVPHVTIVSNLPSGLVRLAEAFPWVAGQVVNTNSKFDGSPSYKIRPFESIPRLTVRAHEDDASIPTFAQMEEAGYPMFVLDEDTWAPSPTITSSAFDPSKPSEIGNDPAPVMLIQLNFVRGGLVLCINMQHNVCDMMGQAAVMEWLWKACREETFTTEELEIGNMQRRRVISSGSGGDAAAVQDDLQGQILPTQQVPHDTTTTKPDVATPLSAPPSCSWVYFKFSSSSLRTLKDLAVKSLPKDFTTFVSTDDALSAFVFKSTLRAILLSHWHAL